MTISLAISEKLFKLASGEQLPASQLKHTLIDELVSEGIILQRITGRTKRIMFIADTVAIHHWLFNKFGINDLSEYIQMLKKEIPTRAEMVQVSSHSKIRTGRTFKGFLVNTFMPVNATLNGVPFPIQPLAGVFTFIYDYETFTLPADMTIVGIENAESFRYIDAQQQLFNNIKPIFVSRYPQEQSKDLMRWLLSIPNPYLHFGDYDFAGINIYYQEYKQHLGDRASFFIPDNIETLLEQYGNSALYDAQKLNTPEIKDEKVQHLIKLLNQYKKGLEQEVLMINR